MFNWYCRVVECVETFDCVLIDPTLNAWFAPNTGISGLDQKLVRLARNGTHPGLLQIRVQYILARWARLALNVTNPGFFRLDFSTFWLSEPKCTEIWSENVTHFEVTHFGPKPYIPVAVIAPMWHWSSGTTKQRYLPSFDLNGLALWGTYVLILLIYFCGLIHWRRQCYVVGLPFV